MTKILEIDVGRTEVIEVGLGYDVTNDDFYSQIREEKNAESPVLVELIVTKADAVSGELLLTSPAALTNAIQNRTGFMDILRITNGEPVSVFDEPLEVSFQRTVTRHED